MRRTVLLLAGTLMASGLAASPATAWEEANVRGRVVDTAGQPLAGVRVTPWLELYDDHFTEMSSYYTNAEGWFYVGDDLTNSTARLRLIDEEGRGLTEFYNGATDLASATDIDVATTDVDLGDIELAPASHITGRLTGEDGRPVTNGVATAFTGGPGDWRGVDTAETDSDGHYDLGGLPAGAYRVRFRDYSGDRFEEVYDDVATLDEGTDVIVGTDDTVEGIDAVLSTTSTVVGQVVDSAGEPAEGVSVLAWAEVDGSWQRVPTGRDETGANGWYVIYGLAAGPHRLELRDELEKVWLPEFYLDSPDLAGARTIDVPAGGQLAVPQARVTRASRVQGTVTDPNGDPTYPVVTAYRRVEGTWVEAASDAPDYAGRYDLRGLTPGSYVIGFDADGGSLVDEFYPHATTLEGATPITLGEEEQRGGVDAQLAATPFTALTAPALTLYGDPTLPFNNSDIEATWATWTHYPISRRWRWFRDGVPVPTDGSRYHLTPADLGSVITVQETAVSEYGQTTTSQSAALTVPGTRPSPTPTPTPEPEPTPTPTPTPEPTPTPTPEPTPNSTPQPAVTPDLEPSAAPQLVGRQEVGAALRVSRGAWPVGGISWSYRWYADGDRIRGADGRTLQVGRRLAEARLSVRVVVRAEDHAPWRARLRFHQRRTRGRQPVD